LTTPPPALAISYNMFYINPGQKTSVDSAPAFLGAFNDVENITINAALAMTTRPQQLRIGAALRVNAGGGQRYVPNLGHGRTPARRHHQHVILQLRRRRLIRELAPITSTSSITTRERLTITRTATTISYSTSGYFLIINLAHLGYLYAQAARKATFQHPKARPPTHEHDM